MKTVEEIIARLKDKADDIDDMEEKIYSITASNILDEIVEWIEGEDDKNRYTFTIDSEKSSHEIKEKIQSMVNLEANTCKGCWKVCKNCRHHVIYNTLKNLIRWIDEK